MTDEIPDPEVEAVISQSVEQGLEHMFPGQPGHIKALALTFMSVPRLEYFFYQNFANAQNTAFLNWPPTIVVASVNGRSSLGAYRPTGASFTSFEHFCLALSWALQALNNQRFNDPWEIRGEDWTISGSPTGQVFTHHRNRRISQKLLALKGGATSSMLEVMGHSESGVARALAGMAGWANEFRKDLKSKKKKRKQEEEAKGNQPGMPPTQQFPPGFGPQGMPPGMPGGPYGMPPGGMPGGLPPQGPVG
jgi:hypothetical protein